VVVTYLKTQDATLIPPYHGMFIPHQSRIWTSHDSWSA